MTGFWILAGLAAVVTIVILAYAMIAAKGNAAATAAYDVQVYRTQLAELDRDVARGVIGEAEAERAKVEISRRLLEADRKLQAGETASKAPASATWIALALSGALILGGGLWLYADIGAPGYWDLPLEKRYEAAAQARENRKSQAEAEAELPEWAGPPPEAPAEYLDLVDRLRAAVQENPDDVRGQELLAQHEASLSNFRAAQVAQGKVIELKGAAATADDYSKYTDLLVLAAGGYISPEAEEAIDQALRVNPRDQVSLYYAGLLNIQIGRPDIAFRIWRDLLEGSDPSEPWVRPIMSDIERLAALAGVDYTPPQLQHTVSGPTAAEIAANESLTPEQRSAMIDDVVAQLMDRLATQGGTAPDWARLIEALGVQGNLERASAIWGEAKNVFAARPDELALIDQAAAKAGLTEALPFTPGESGAPAPALAGPSAEDMEAAADMTAEEQSDMISAMVARLEDELMTEGGAPERWVQLFNVLGVLGDAERAKAAWAKAQTDYAGDDAALAQIRGAAKAVGATE